MHRLILIVLCFIFSFAGAADDPDHISVDCGGGAALSGGRWHGDVYTAAAAPKGGQSSTVTGGEVITAVDPVPYKTARISRSQFSYSFHLNPGQKFIRLHFNPVSYHAFEGFNDFFTVEAGPFTLLANFSASLTARALALNILVKEFCLITQANQTLNIVFSPETSQSKHNYAFINGIEIISVPSTVAYCHGGNSGIHVLGQKSVIYVDNTSALERVYHHNMKWGSVLDDFGMWASNLKGNAKKASNLSWRVCVDVGFRYLVRIHLCELGLKMDDFVLLIDDMIALTSADMLQQGGNQSILWFNYMVMVEGHKREGRRSISISLNSQRGPLEGFEVFKLSNHDRTLASPNPTGDGAGDSPPQTIQTLLRSLLGRRNAVATVVFTMICLVNIIVHLLHKMWGTNFTEEENMPSARGKQLCRPFSLAEIQSATDYFHEASVLGKGGFGKVYKGFIDNRREIVAIKRSKLDSKHGEHQFWAEVDTLSELRHVNLVSLIGYCREQQEMILVYEFMPCGSLADHLYKIARKGNAFHPLSWKQRLKICIGAGRALDYLHTGHGIIHRDVKSSNILLDHKLVAKVSDFGLAKTGSGGSQSQSEYSTNLKGTPGYIDPNYHRTCKLTKKSDTYSFGVVLLEVLCGRKAVEKWHEEDERILKTWAIDNISKGQVADIVAPSLRGEISPDSLKTFVKVAERCLHDEPKKRPAIAHVLIKLELALQQQEKAESLDTKERTGGEDFISSSDNSKKENMSFMVPNEKINAADAMPQMDNARSSALNEIRNVTDAMLCADNDKTKLSVNPRPMMSSCNVQTDMSMLREQSTNTMIISGRKDVRKSMMLRISQIIWPWKNKKPSNKTDVVGVAVSAPVSHRTSNITLSGNTISDKRTDGMILTPTLRIFSFEEVNTATRNFSEDSVLKEGGFGKLYKGWIHENSSSKKRSGSVVAIKKLNHESTQEFKQWQSEVNFLGRLSHPNLVKLLGYGWEDEVLFLVYECMPCGTLADHLYKLARKSNDFYPLSWRQRLKICIGVGRALDYLHAGHGIIHLNVKASNIVLDEKFGAKLSDFSLAVNGSGSESQSQDSTNLIGTFGCTDPNYLKTRKPTLKSDTYSFGVVLLEVLCGRQAVEPWNDEDKCSLTTWAIDNISSGQVDDIVAPSLRGEISPDSLKTFVKVAETCLHDEPKKRPSTAHVITKLELALQQQEKAESLPPNERTSVREVLSPTDKSQKEKINFMVASEKTNVADIVSPSLGGQMLPQPSVRSFTFSELKAATRNFRSEAVLGVGGFGVVYKGWINVKCSGKDGSETPIAVKKLNSGSTQGFDEWQSEIEFLGRISHPNLVKLLGYCLEDKELILVYEFMPKGSLDNHLFRSRQPLPWDIRLKILIGAARGMAFLHASEGQVIYRDFKPSNILLDESYHAKLSDFGLAKMGPTDGHSHVTTRIMGTYGYAAPEYVATGHLYVKSDVYGFGVVLVEMLTGLRALDTRRPAGQHNLVDWMKPHLSKKKKLQHVIDKHLVGTYPAKSAAQLAQLAFKCLENEPRNRPSMQEVVQTLETIADRPAQRRVHFSH